MPSGLRTGLHPRLLVVGTCVAAAGDVKWGKPTYREMQGSQNAEGELLGGNSLVELAAGETATVTVKPARGIDLGAGPGLPVAHAVTGQAWA